MKYLLCILIVLLFAFTGCSGGSPVNQPQEAVSVASDSQIASSDAHSAADQPKDTVSAVPNSQAAASDVYNTFTEEQRKALNTFLSNFSEIYPMMTNFDASAPNEAEILDFLYRNVYFNLSDKFKPKTANIPELYGESAYETLSADYLNTLTRYYFDGVVLHHPIAANTERTLCAYRNGVYYFPGSGGAQITCFSVVESYVPAGDGSAQVTFTVYKAGLDPKDLEGLKHGSLVRPEFYALTAEEAREKTSSIQAIATGTATVKENDGKYKLQKMSITAV